VKFDRIAERRRDAVAGRFLDGEPVEITLEVVLPEGRKRAAAGEQRQGRGRASEARRQYALYPRIRGPGPGSGDHGGGWRHVRGQIETGIYLLLAAALLAATFAIIRTRDA
jgi:hypothetical protein